ncbi:MAG: hypothetical protein M5U26_13540 [Planctomycetota bacterium]|nr:hypothetical protein [Planctomycetota bacterium]
MLNVRRFPFTALLAALLFVFAARAESDKEKDLKKKEEHERKPGPALELAAGVTVSTSSGCRVGAGETVLLDRVATQPQDAKWISLEAEDAGYVDPQGDAAAHRSGRSFAAGSIVQVYAGETKPYEAGKDEKASGGAYVDFLDQYSIDFNVAEPGAYYRWVRYWISWGGHWNYQSQVDDGPIQPVLLNNLKLKDWFWMRDKEPYELSAGTHKHHGMYLHNGKRIDKIVFTRDPDWKPDPDGTGPEKSPLEFVAEGTVVTKPFKPVSARRWISVLLPGARNGGAIAGEVSLDGGATYLPLPADGSLGFLGAPRGDGNDALVFRFTLQRAKDRPSPVLQTPVVVYEADADAFAILEDEALRLLVDRRSGAPAGIVNKAAGVTVQEAGLPTSFIDLRIKKPGSPARDVPWASLKLEAFKSSKDSVDARYLAPTPEGDVELRSRMKLEKGGRLALELELDNRSGYDVLETGYPKLEGLKLGERSDDDVLVWPYQAGMFHVGPCLLGTVEIGYPAGMAWIDLFGDEGGLYLGSHDPYIVATKVRSASDTALERVSLSFTKRHRIAAGTKKRYSYLLAAHAGDWHDGADLYRAWFYSAFPRPMLPQWLKDTHGWQTQGALKEKRPRHYTELFHAPELALVEGLDYCQMWGSTFNGACPSYYLPRKECGGEEAFTGVNAWWRGLGHHIGYYFHGNSTGFSYIMTHGAFTPDEMKVLREAFDAYAKEAKLADPGKLWQERFVERLHSYFDTPWSEYPAELRPMSWADYVKYRGYESEDYKVEREKYLKDFAKRHAQADQHNSEDDYSHFSSTAKPWQDFLCFWTDRYVNRYRCDTVYYDTMAFGCDHPDFNPHLGLHGEGDAAMHRLKLLDRIIEASRRTTPGYANLVEGVGDVWGTRMYMLLSGFARNPEIFRYTFPDMVMFQGHANGYWSGEKSYQSIREAFLLANKFDVIHASEMVRDLIYVRQQLGPWMTRGTFLDTKGLRVPDPRLHAKGFRVNEAGGRGALVTFHNAHELSGLPVSLDLAPYGTLPRRAFALEAKQDPAPLAFYIRDGKAHFVAPAAKSAAVLLVEEAAGPFAATVLVRSAEAEAHLTAEAMNWSGAPLGAELECWSPEEKPRQVRVALELRPGQVSRTRFEFPEAAARTLVRPVRVRLRTSLGDSFDAVAGMLPRVLDGSFERDVPAGSVEEGARDGRRAVDIRKHGARRRVFLEPGRKFDLSCWVKAAAGQALPEVAVRQGAARQVFEKSGAAQDGWVELVAKGIEGQGYSTDEWSDARSIEVKSLPDAPQPVLVDAFAAAPAK